MDLPPDALHSAAHAVAAANVPKLLRLLVGLVTHQRPTLCVGASASPQQQSRPNYADYPIRKQRPTPERRRTPVTLEPLDELRTYSAVVNGTQWVLYGKGGGIISEVGVAASARTVVINIRGQ